MNFKTVSALQQHLKNTIATSNIEEVVMRVVRRYIDENVYQAYTPSGLDAYDRTYELLSAVEVMQRSTGSTHHRFEVAINPMQLEFDNTRSLDGQWNAHASMPPTSNDVRELIPLWIEEGTSGSLWDRDGAYFNWDAWQDLGNGTLVRALLKELQRAGYDAHLK